MSVDPRKFLGEARARIDAELDRLLPAEREAPEVLHRAMRYSVFAGGKRLRPALTLAAARLDGDGWDLAAPAAAALELIHTYSLIHDDLPAMDDDELRRGKPTCHVVFGEAQAILAGDALLTLAFEVLSREPEGERHAGRRLEAVRLVARAAGPAGMVGGQSADVLAGQSAGGSRDLLEFIHARKTGALFGASVALGALLTGLDAASVRQLDHLGRTLGTAFQIADDILDVEGETRTLGKTAGKDVRSSKLTWPALLGLEESRRQARRLVETVEAQLLARFGASAASLLALARFVVERSA